MGCFQALLPDVNFGRVRLGILSGSVDSEVLPIRPDSKDRREFLRLPMAIQSRIEPRTST